MLSTLLGWLREPAIQIPVLVVVAALYAAGAVNRWRQRHRRRRTFYLAAGILFALWEWHMAWWLLVGAGTTLILGTDDLWRGSAGDSPSPATASNDTGQ